MNNSIRITKQFDLKKSNKMFWLAQKDLKADKKADQVINAMILGLIGTAIVSTHVSWTLVASIMGTGAVLIGLCYTARG